MAEVVHVQALRQSPGAAHLDAVGVELDEDVGAFEEPVAVHDRVGDRLAQRLHRVLRHVLPPQALDPVGGAGVALDEAHGVLDVGDDAAVEVLPVQDVDLVRAPPEQARDVRLREEMPHVPGEEEHAGVAEQQPAPVPLGRLDVDQHVLHRQPGGDVRVPEPGVELPAVEVFRVPEAGAGRQVEPDRPLRAEEVADLVAAELLRHRALPPEEAVAALHRLGVALAHVDHEHSVHRLRQHLHRRVAVAGDVLHAGAQGVGVSDPLHGTVVAHAEENLAADGVRQRDDLAGERRRRQGFLELQRRAFALLDEDFEIRRCGFRHACWPSAACLHRNDTFAGMRRPANAAGLPPRAAMMGHGARRTRHDGGGGTGRPRRGDGD